MIPGGGPGSGEELCGDNNNCEGRREEAQVTRHHLLTPAISSGWRDTGPQHWALTARDYLRQNKTDARHATTICLVSPPIMHPTVGSPSTAPDVTTPRVLFSLRSCSLAEETRNYLIDLHIKLSVKINFLHFSLEGFHLHTRRFFLCLQIVKLTRHGYIISEPEISEEIPPEVD